MATEPEIIGPEEIEGAASSVSVKSLSGIQRAALWLLAGVGCVGAVVILVLVSYLGWVFFTFPRPSFEPGNDQVEALKLYEESLDAAVERVRQVFEIFILSALLPLFTLLVGYLFGKGGGSRSSDN